MQVTILLGTVAHFVMGLSGKSCDFIISVVAMIIRMAMATGPSSSYSSNQTTILEQLPTSLFTTLSQLDVDSPTTTYAACLSCNFTHKAVYDRVTTAAVYPDQCLNTILGKEGRSVCGEELLETRDGSKRPLKPFVVASLHDYLVRTLTDPEAERLCKKACDDALTNVGKAPEPESTNIFNSAFMKTFEGPVSGQLFIDRGRKVRASFSISLFITI